MPTMSDLTKRLSAEDYEERKLVETFLSIQRRATKSDEGKIGNVRLKPELSKDDKQSLQETLSRLGYDPTGERPAKQRGRPRDASLPKPLPAPGTKLLSVLGEEYEVLAYLRRPCSDAELDPDMIVYRDAESKVVVRSVIHMFCGTLNDRPFVTWPDDPRGYDPQKAIPLNKRRVLRKQDLKEDRLLQDADYQQDLEARAKGRKY